LNGAKSNNWQELILVERDSSHGMRVCPEFRSLRTNGLTHWSGIEIDLIGCLAGKCLIHNDLKFRGSEIPFFSGAASREE